jgi:hypothetical protein
MRSLRFVCFALLALATSVVPAHADVTAFLGATTTPNNRQVRGVALGTGLLVIGFEFEYSSTVSDASTGSPSLKVGSANGLIQTPMPIFGMQLYATAGGSLYRERLGSSTDTGFGPNIGGGVKIGLVGPLRLRVDYRVFKLGSDARYSPSHRIYAGLNLKF